MKKHTYTSDNGTEWTVKTYTQLRKYSARSVRGVVLAATYIKLMERMEAA